MVAVVTRIEALARRKLDVIQYKVLLQYNSGFGAPMDLPISIDARVGQFILYFVHYAKLPGFTPIKRELRMYWERLEGLKISEYPGRIV